MGGATRRHNNETWLSRCATQISKIPTFFVWFLLFSEIPTKFLLIFFHSYRKTPKELDTLYWVWPVCRTYPLPRINPCFESKIFEGSQGINLREQGYALCIPNPNILTLSLKLMEILNTGRVQCVFLWFLIDTDLKIDIIHFRITLGLPSPQLKHLGEKKSWKKCKTVHKVPTRWTWCKFSKLGLGARVFKFFKPYFLLSRMMQLGTGKA